MFGKTLENKNTCLYNKTMNIEIKIVIIQHRRNYRFSLMRQNMMWHVRQVVPAAVERKENSAIQRHAASVTVLQRTEDVFLY